MSRLATIGGLALAAIVISVLLLVQVTEAQPSVFEESQSRHKRVSDQRLLELEELISLVKQRNDLKKPIDFIGDDPFKIRPKRVSDQRVAELETVISLGKMKGQLVKVPVAFGQLDPMKIGRKRRSSTESNIQAIRRILRSLLENETAELSPEYIEYAKHLIALARWQDQQEAENDDRGENELDLN